MWTYQIKMISSGTLSIVEHNKYYIVRVVIVNIFVKLFRLCLSTSTFPSYWKFAHVQPLPKKGDRSNPSNYRPIALISCLSKAFESILNRKFLIFFDLEIQKLK